MPAKINLPIKLRLPEDITWGDDRAKIIKRFSNLNLLYNKYPLIWTKKDNLNEAFQTDYEYLNDKGKKEKVNLKHQFLVEVLDNFDISESDECLKGIAQRQTLIVASLKSSGWHVESFNATSESRLIIGLGGTSVIETGMTLHPLYGFPYLPGSGLKGLARAYAEIVEVAPKEELLEIFGSEDKDPHNVANNRQGKVFFMDGLPLSFPKLELDIMNPHYSEYYQGNKPPADYLNPVPVTFLAVAAGQKFSFAVYSRDKSLTEKAKAWLIGGLTELGAGGKTNVGYGYFKDFSDVTIEKPAVITNQPEKSESNIQERVKKIKNQQTFADFLKNIKDDEINALNSISFKGMESIINIGLAEVLESVEVSLEIKKTIAQKMVEVCKEPDKKYAEKFEKYKKLQAMADRK